MKLQRQLLIVSLCILFLPWAGCQYIREMERTLRDGQHSAQLAHAQAVATTVSIQAPQFFQTSAAEIDPQRQVYFHPLQGEMIIDGYDGDWLGLDYTPLIFKAPEHNAPDSLALHAGEIQSSLFLLFDIKDSSPIPHNPQAAGIANGDYLILHCVDDQQAIKQFILRSSGSGAFTARYENSAGSIRQEHRIRGFWQETQAGYKVELQLPKSVVGRTLGITYINASANSNAQYGNTFTVADGTWQQPQPWISSSTPLATVIKPYTRDDLRITLLDAQQWIIARSGELNKRQQYQSAETNKTPWFLAWFYRLALDENNFAPIDDPLTSGRMTASEVVGAIKGEQSKAWYRFNDQRIGRVTTPISIDGTVRGVVVVEQTTESLMAATNEAFNQLFFTILSTMGAVVIVLLIYASLLSLRIRRLSRAADNAIGDDGKISGDFISSKAKDEIGDLTRSYGQLLYRLKDYTDYLRTLASKLSHELRTPLAVVKSSLDNLDHSNLSEEALRYHERAREGANRLSVILNAMSAANRIEESIHQANKENFNLSNMLADLVDAYRSAYQTHHFSLSVSHDDCVLFGSPDLIVQMLDKLVDNAADFSPNGSTILLSLQKNKKQLSLAVSNQGPLLPEHMQGQLFDSLVSVRDANNSRDNTNVKNNNAKEEKTHLGLGLYIVRLIVDFHQGHIAAKNSENLDGVTFTMQFPTQE